MKFASLIALGSLLGACGGDAAGGVDLTIEADGCMAARADAIEVVVHDGVGEQTGIFTRSVDEGLVFPTGVRVLARDASSREFTVDAVLFAEGLPIAMARYRGVFTDTLVEARVLFEDACFGQICEVGTCSAGRCDEEDVVLREPSPAAGCPGHVYVQAGTSGDCLTPETPCASIPAGLAALDGPGVVELHGGASYPPLDIRVDGVTVRAWPGTGRPVIDAAGEPDGVIVAGADITIDGLEVMDASEHGVTVNSAVNQRVTLRRLEVHDCGYGVSEFNNHGGVHGNNDASDFIIEDSIFRDNVTEVAGRRAVGIYLNKQIRPIIRRNLVRGNPSEGIYLSAANDALISENRVEANGAAGILVFNSDARIVDNLICDSGGSGVFVTGTETLRVEHNTVLHSREHGMWVDDRVEKRVERNIFAFSGEAGLRASPVAQIVHGGNLYFENAGGDQVGVEPGDSDVFADPQLLGERCTSALAEGSPAQNEDPAEVIGVRTSER